MTLLAHWPINDGRNRPATPQTIQDIAAGGSGSHDGQITTWGYESRLQPGGVGGCHQGRVVSLIAGGWIQNIGNPSDLQLLGEMSVCLWGQNNQYGGWDWGATILASCSGYNNSEAENSAWIFAVLNRKPEFYWYSGASSTITYIVTPTPALSMQGFQHLTAVRYLVSAGKYGVKFYIDGALVYTDDNSGAGYDPPTGCGNSVPYIARRRDGFVISNYLGLSYDSPRIYDHALSDAEVLSIFNAEEPYTRPALDTGFGGLQNGETPDYDTLYDEIPLGDSYQLGGTEAESPYEDNQIGEFLTSEGADSGLPNREKGSGYFSKRPNSGWVIP